VARRLELEAIFPGTVSEAFSALARTLAFRRWGYARELFAAGLPAAGSGYRYQTGSVLRVGRIVAVTRPVGLTLKEMLHDPPCRVALTLRWRVDPVPAGTAVRVSAGYRLNHAAMLRARHWDRRLHRHLYRQFSFVAANLDCMHDKAVTKRDLTHHRNR